MERLHELAAAGTLDGLDTCDGLLGGAVVGLRDGSFWAPCIITGVGLELYANAEELGEPAPVLLPQISPKTLSEGVGYIALDKPTGLRTEDALRHVREKHPAADLVSRLDKATSGCLVVATSIEGVQSLTQQFKDRTVHKAYIALVHGSPLDAGTINAPLGLTELGGGSRYRAFVTDDSNGKPAVTDYRVLQRFADANVALVVAYPRTERTHQIRCHMAHAGFPLVGDTKYEGRIEAWCRRLPLHCLRTHAVAVDGAAIDAFAALPAEFPLPPADEAAGLSSAGWAEVVQSAAAWDANEQAQGSCKKSSTGGA